MVNCKTASALTIAALLAGAIPLQSMAAFASAQAVIVAQATPSFPVPESVPKGTKVRVSSSSDNMNAITALLQKGFEDSYADSKIEIVTKGVDATLQDVLNDNADLAAISRPLTEEEKAKGLIEVPVRREKIAVVVGKDNPFAQSLTGSQFARIFRGEIKDWSEVGGKAGAIRVIDRPATSETRQALSPYPVFKTAAFETGDNATQLAEDSIEALSKEIGNNGIGYVLVGQLQGQTELRALELHKTPPTDLRYPFSQPYSFVYAGGASPAVQAFLGYATGRPGQAVINSAGLTGDSILPAAANDTAGSSNGGVGDGAANGSTTGDIGNEQTADARDGDATDAANGADAGTTTEGGAGGPDTTANSDSNSSLEGTNPDTDSANNADRAGGLAARGSWWWLLLPLGGLGLLIWAAGRRGTAEETGYIANTGGSDGDAIHSNLGDDTSVSGIPGTGAGSDKLGSFSIGSLGSGSGHTGSDYIGLEDGTLGKGSIDKAAAGGAAIAGGVAAAGIGLAGRGRDQASDARASLEEDIPQTTDVNLDDGVDIQLQENIQGGIQNDFENIQGVTQGSIDGVRTKVQGSIQDLQSGIEAGKPTLEGIGNVKAGGIQGVGQERVNEVKQTVPGGNDVDNWLERAKQRINEATEQMKETASEIKDDISHD